MGRAIRVYDSTGNIFEDLGLPDADELLAKATLAHLVRVKIKRRGLTQTAAAKLLGVRQPDISDLVRGNLDRFSLLRLQRFLNALDLEVRIQVGPRPANKKRAGISVETVKSF